MAITTLWVVCSSCTWLDQVEFELAAQGHEQPSKLMVAHKPFAKPYGLLVDRTHLVIRPPPLPIVSDLACCSKVRPLQAHDWRV